MIQIYNKEKKRHEFYKDKAKYLSEIIILVSFVGILSLMIGATTLGYINTIFALVIGIFLTVRIYKQLLLIIRYKKINLKVLSLGEDNIELYLRDAFGVKFDYNDILSCRIENEIENLFSGPYIKNIIVIEIRKEFNQIYKIRISELDLGSSYFYEINDLINEKILQRKMLVNQGVE